MSAPNTNIETQKHRHRGPLSGMALVVAFAGTLLLALLVYLSLQSDGPEGSALQVDGRTGEITVNE